MSTRRRRLAATLPARRLRRGMRRCLEAFSRIGCQPTVRPGIRRFADLLAAGPPAVPSVNPFE